LALVSASARRTGADRRADAALRRAGTDPTILPRTSVLVYYLAFKFVGTGVHALQVAGLLPATPRRSYQHDDFIGLFPTIETTMVQAALLALALGVLVWPRLRGAEHPRQGHRSVSYRCAILSAPGHLIGCEGSRPLLSILDQLHRPGPQPLILSLRTQRRLGNWHGLCPRTVQERSKLRQTWTTGSRDGGRRRCF